MIIDKNNMVLDTTILFCWFYEEFNMSDYNYIIAPKEVDFIKLGEKYIQEKKIKCPAMKEIVLDAALDWSLVNLWQIN